MSRRIAALALGAAACTSASEKAPAPSYWKPGTAYASPEGPNARGYLDRRGLVHAHSYLSHDACDGALGKTGQVDQPCLDDFRRDFCAVKHDFVFLSDHNTGYADFEYPDTLLHRADKGDQLVQRGGEPVASRLKCDDGRMPLVMAGTESETMPVGLERHVAPKDARHDLYNQFSAEAFAAFHANGAVTLVAHTEDWTLEQLTDPGLDGFEMYNLHENTVREAATAIELYGMVIQKLTAGLPVPDLVFLEFFTESPEYLASWGSVLASGKQPVTTMGTDCHRNSFPDKLEDGERVDSYRRMMGWFSNHLLVKPRADGPIDDRDLKEALAHARLYGVFEVLGTPSGFDFRAEAAGKVHELGETVSLADAPVLVATRPAVRDLDPVRAAPKITVRVLKAKEGGWDELAAGEADQRVTITTPGAYRAEVRIEPTHLREDLREHADKLLSRDYPWIYTNAIYVR